ncbi:MAG: M48 family metallopeptidase [Lachnospiraceae bacterium]
MTRDWLLNNYKVVRSGRRTMGLELKSDGLIVRIPYYVTDREAERFVKGNVKWIERRLAKLNEREALLSNASALTAEEIRELAKQAAEVIPERVAYYAPLIGVEYGRITIRSQKTRWGSCSRKGNLNFNCLLMLAPPQVIDSVVVHELCHLKEMNHSKRFYKEVLRVFPEYKIWQKWLKENGPVLMARMKKANNNK